MLQQFAATQSGIKLKRRAHLGGQAKVAAKVFQLLLKRRADFGAVNDFAGGHAGNPVGQLGRVALGQMHQALRDAEPCQAATCAVALVNGQYVGFGFVAEQGAVGQRARRDHAHHFALDGAFARTHIAHLLANRHGFAEFDEA